MSRRVLPRFAFPLAALLCTAPPALDAQEVRSSIGAGISSPQDDLQLIARPGLTVRGQVGLPILGLLRGHGQLGYTRFRGRDRFEATDIGHAGAGVRLDLGALWFGANGYYLFGDIEDGFGFAPEIGTRFGRLEFVSDYLFGRTEWAAVRVAWRF